MCVCVLCSRQQPQLPELSARCPVSHFWDESEARLLVCETVPVGAEPATSSQPDMVPHPALVFCVNTTVGSPRTGVHCLLLLLLLLPGRCLRGHLLLHPGARPPPSRRLPQAPRPAGSAGPPRPPLLLHTQGSPAAPSVPRHHRIQRPTPLPSICFTFYVPRGS